MKKMIKLFLALALFLSVTSASAHSPDISTFSLIEQESGQWILQLNASLTAFEYEVEHAYGKDAYASPEEFNQLVLNHLREQITITVNGDKVVLADGFVQLGHATNVVFTLSGVPEAIEKVFVKNEGFKNINRSQSIFTIVKQGSDKNQFVLNAANDYQLHGSLKDDQILLAETSSVDYWMVVPVMVMMVGLLGFILFKKSRRKKTIVLPISHPIVRH